MVLSIELWDVEIAGSTALPATPSLPWLPGGGDQCLLGLLVLEIGLVGALGGFQGADLADRHVPPAVAVGGVDERVGLDVDDDRAAVLGPGAGLLAAMAVIGLVAFLIAGYGEPALRRAIDRAIGWKRPGAGSATRA